MKKRNYNLDLIRCVAVFLVLSVHFFINSNYYATLMIGKRMYVSTVVRTGFMACVPLFLLLTGYLMANKKLGKDYYKGIRKTLAIYLGASICCGLFRYFHLNETDIKELILGVFSFSTAPYAWYIEMYIGLFLLIPFLNIIGNNLKNKKEDCLLLLTCIVLTVLPSMFNIYSFKSLDWWSHPSSSFEYNKLWPEFWTRIYPITYYFIGRYIRKYEISIKQVKRRIIILYGILLMLFGSFNYWRGYGQMFPWDSYTDWGGFENTILAVLLFLILKEVNLNGLPEIGKKTVNLIAEMSLGMYLVSWIFDTVFYGRLNKKIDYMPDKLPYYFIIVPVGFLASFAISFVINLIYKSFENKFDSLRREKL